MSTEIQECAVHTHHVEEDCEVCTKEFEQLRKQHSSKVQSNNSKGERIASQGMGINSVKFVQARLDLLINSIFGNNTKDWIRFEIEFQRQVEQLLNQALKEIRAAQLVVPTPGSRLQVGKPPGGAQGPIR